jgi:predicted ArsR family transcriptional regulator
VTTDETTQAVRSAIEDRAMYLYLLFKEMQAANGEAAVEMARRAIFRYGQLKAQSMGPMESPVDFIRHQTRPGRREIFEKQVVEETPERCEIRFHYCPLVQAWRRLGTTAEELAQLCDIAMQGDFGMVSAAPFTLRIAATIAGGDECCRLILEARE